MFKDINLLKGIVINKKTQHKELNNELSLDSNKRDSTYGNINK